jgi:hypothetical protein
MKRPVRFFNTTGPCNPDDHYMLPPEERLKGAQLHRYVRDKLYWMLHAPRQTGKTTFLQSWMRELNAGGGVVACYVSVERAQGIGEIERAMPAICEAVREFAAAAGLPVPQVPGGVDAASLLSATLVDWAGRVAPKPLVVLFDETDVLQDAALISFLRQLRGGFAVRGIGTFPVSIALVGMRDLRDYLTASKGGVPVNPGSPFNIKQDSAVIGNFTREHIARLFAQRTEETGQPLAPEALDYVWEQSRGQPWIVNSLFMRATMQVLHEDDYSPVTLEHVREAREMLVAGRETHLDALGKRLADPRIKAVIQAILTGDLSPFGRDDEDMQFVMDLGLVRWDSGSAFTIANPIYTEILTRHLNSRFHDNLPPPSTYRWQKPDGSLDMDALLRAFQTFWRRHSEMWEERSDYTEAFPHLLLMAFLQRLTNGGGRIGRECASGRGSMDLLVEYEGQSNIIEVKLWRGRDTRETLVEEGVEQVLAYRDRLGGGIPCYLVVFDRRPPQKRAPWENRISWSQAGGVTVVGC